MSSAGIPQEWPTTPIEVFVPWELISTARNEDEAKLRVYAKCVAAGMPVAMDPFASSFYALRGELHTLEDRIERGVRITWVPDKPPVKPTVWSHVKRIAKAIWEF